MALDQQAAAAAGAAIQSTLQMVIGGETVAAADGQTFEIVNPADGQVIGDCGLTMMVLGGRAEESMVSMIISRPPFKPTLSST